MFALTPSCEVDAGAEKKKKGLRRQICTVCPADDKTRRGDTSASSVDSAYRAGKLVFAAQSYRTCLGARRDLVSLVAHFPLDKRSLSSVKRLLGVFNHRVGFFFPSVHLDLCSYIFSVS